MHHFELKKGTHRVRWKSLQTVFCHWVHACMHACANKPNLDCQAAAKKQQVKVFALVMLYRAHVITIEGKGNSHQSWRRRRHRRNLAPKSGGIVKGWIGQKPKPRYYTGR
jgi:hypothetical protein